MSASYIHSLSPELLCQVLASCDSLQEVVSLSTTCKRLYSIWASNSSAILPYAAPRCIPGFDEALVASRVTSLVKNAILDRRAPPRSGNIDIASFSASVSRPTLSDIPHVVHLHRLANLVEKAYLNGLVRFENYDMCWEMERDKSTRSLPPQDECNNQNLKEYFHRAIYRVLLAGPVVAGWYLEPFSTKGIPNIRPPDVPPNLRMFVQNQEPDPDLELENQDIVYLEQSIAFDQTANARLSGKQDRIFGSLATWLISIIREHVTPQDIVWAQEKWPNRWPEDFELLPRPGLLGIADATREETRVALREVMRMVVAYEYLANMTFNFNGRLGHGRVGNEQDLDPLNVFPHWPQSSTSAIILGVYQLEELRIVDDHIVASPAILESSTRAEMLGGDNISLPVDINLIQDFIYRESGRVNYIDDALTPPPNLQLFTFILNRSFGLQFSEGYMFQCNKYNNYFNTLLDDCAIFYERMVHPGERPRTSWIDLLMPTTQSPVYSYQPI